EEIERQVAAGGCTYFVCRLAFGNMSEAEAAASIALFTAEVMPRLIALAPPAPWPARGSRSLDADRLYAIGRSRGEGHEEQPTLCARVCAGLRPARGRLRGTRGVSVQAGRRDALGAVRDAPAPLVRPG